MNQVWGPVTSALGSTRTRLGAVGGVGAVQTSAGGERRLCDLGDMYRRVNLYSVFGLRPRISEARLRPRYVVTAFVAIEQEGGPCIVCSCCCTSDTCEILGRPMNVPLSRWSICVIVSEFHQDAK